MAQRVDGLHHVTSLAGNAVANNRFFTETLGLRRVKKTVNFDAPDVYHLYFGDEVGQPGTLITYFPFEGARRGRGGTGEASVTGFSVPPCSLDAWQARLEAGSVGPVHRDRPFGEDRLLFEGPDGETLALVGTADDRRPWADGPVAADMAIRGLHAVTLRLGENEPTAELLRLMGFREIGREGTVTRLALAEHNGAGLVDLERVDGPAAAQGAGSVHHVAFAVPDRDAQDAMRRTLAEAGHGTTPVIDRDYFHAIYFRSPGGVLFEIATNLPGFARDEDPAHLGEALQLPEQHAHLRDRLERELVPLEG
ncbi:glyoxalase family protein [Rhodovulum sp. ES.010]|uniref:ring-cleaving dioxygenase n=1 Tax=Rhodovulum sp. ES.010 TaxID=1882821 RepID=UPI0009288E3E|nr:ring-cleaving dioxygenase [Rhodovulum sp. ES.010]SIO49710.1 glyoxalase family protein [Rhodovulum sp. ES.010]